MKYVIIDDIFPVVFPGAVSHRAMRGLGTITGAGFVKFHTQDGLLDVAVFGHSQTLEMHAQPEDAETIKRILFKT